MTKAQLRIFFRAVSRAASALGLVGREEVENYRHEVMAEEVKAFHACDVDPGDGFDRVMYRLAVDAGDWEAASRFATGSDRRMAHLVEQCARQVIELKAVAEADPFLGDGVADPRAAAVDYVVGILRQAHMPVAGRGDDWWMDVSGDMAFSVFRMLDTHRRRILRSLCWCGPFAFDAGKFWGISDGQVFSGRVISPIPPPIRVGRAAA